MPITCPTCNTTTEIPAEQLANREPGKCQCGKAYRFVEVTDDDYEPRVLVAWVDSNEKEAAMNEKQFVDRSGSWFSLSQVVEIVQRAAGATGIEIEQMRAGAIYSNGSIWFQRIQ